jgi:4-hydroxy-3-methylbut-2-enyl diphosphate reductase
MDMALAEAKLAPRGACATMGPLIHNPRALETLKSRGLDIFDEQALPGDLRGRVVIIRAHGISPVLEAELCRRGARIVDATCPKVKASQTMARNLSAQGYRIFLAGEKQHGEIIGIQGYAPLCTVVANPQETAKAVLQLCCAESGQDSPGAKTAFGRIVPGQAALIGQTTITPEEYAAIGEMIRGFFPELRIMQTICGATRDRQDALKELCRRVNGVIVAGGRDSANTRRLLAIAHSHCAGSAAWLVEKAGDIPREIAACPVVGLSAGASTPDGLIDDIEQALLTI